MTENKQLQGEALKRTDFMELLPDLDAGVYVQQVGVALSEAALAAVQTGKKSAVTLKLTIKQVGDSSTVTLEHALKLENPTPKGKRSEERSTSTPLYVARGGRLTLFPESQPNLFKDQKDD